MKRLVTFLARARKALVGAAGKSSVLAGSHNDHTRTDSGIYFSEEWKMAIGAAQSEDWVQMLKATQALVRRFPEQAVAHS